MDTFAFFILFFTVLNTGAAISQLRGLLRKKSIETMNIYFYISLFVLNTSVFMLGLLKTEHSVISELLNLNSLAQMKHLFIYHILVWNGLLPGVIHLLIIVTLVVYDEERKFDSGILAVFVPLWFWNLVLVRATHGDFAVTLGYVLYVFFTQQKLRTVRAAPTRGSLNVGQFLSMSASACAWIMYGFLSDRLWFAFWPAVCLVLYLPIIYFWWKKPKYENTF